MRCPGPYAELPRAWYWRWPALVPRVASAKHLQVQHRQRSTADHFVAPTRRLQVHHRPQMTFAFMEAPPKRPRKQHTQQRDEDYSKAPSDSPQAAYTKDGLSRHQSHCEVDLHTAACMLWSWLILTRSQSVRPSLPLTCQHQPRISYNRGAYKTQLHKTPTT